MSVLFEFHPADDGWTDSIIDVYDEIHGEVTDSFDYRAWCADEDFDGSYSVLAYKETSRIGNLIRFKGSFSISRLPDKHAFYDQFNVIDVLEVAYSADPGGDWFYNWDWDTSLRVWDDGSLSFRSPYDAPFSANKIVAGTTYDLEMVIDNSCSPSVWTVYVDGDLWLTETGLAYAPWWNQPFVRFMEGQGFPGYIGPWDVTVHIGENSDGVHVWTIEGPLANGRWSMHAVLWPESLPGPDTDLPWLPSDGRNHYEWNGHASRPASPRALPATRDFVPPDAIEFFATKVSDTLYTDLEQWSDHIELYTDSDGHVVMEVGDNPAATSSQTMVEDTVYDLNLSADVTGDTEVDTLKMNGEIWIEIENTADPKGFTEYSYVAATDDFDGAQVIMADVTMKMMEIVTLSS